MKSDLETANLINQAVSAALPSGKVHDLVIQPSPSCDASGRVIFGEGKTLDAAFETGTFPSTALLDQAVRRIEAYANVAALTPFLIAPSFSEAKQSYLRERRMNYLDAAGNAWVETTDILIDRRGKKPSSSQSELPQDPFSDKATLVARLLFSGGTWGIRQIGSTLASQGFRLSPGYVSKILTTLAERRYAIKSPQGVRLINRNLLLQDWAETYQRKNRRTRNEGWFLPEPDAHTLSLTVGKALGDAGALTDRAGAYLIDAYASFDTVDVIPHDHAAVRSVLESLGAQQVERGANINLKSSPYALSSFYGMRWINGVPVVSDLQLYLDLCCQPQRGREAADHLYDRAIRPLLVDEARP